MDNHANTHPDIDASENPNQPLVSVLVPVYNVERYLAQCLQSICAQTYKNLEIICINDGSTDSSPHILRDFANRDGRIRIIDKPNSGYGDSMNQGLEAARGKYIGIVESDDFIDPGMYEAYVRAAESCDADMVKSNYYQYWQDRDTYYGSTTMVEPEAKAAGNESSADEKMHIFELAGVPTGVVLAPHKSGLSFTLGPSIWSALYNREFLQRNGICFATTPGAAFQDASFSHEVLMAAERAIFLSDAWLHYRVDSAGSSSNSPDKVFLVFGEFDRSLDYLKALPIWKTDEGTRIAAALGAVRMASYMWSYNRIASRFKLQYALRWRRDMFELNREGLIDYSLLRQDSRDLLALLADDPLGFVARCAESPDWFYYAYQPYENGLAERLPRKLYHATRHAAGRIARASLSRARGAAARIRSALGHVPSEADDDAHQLALPEHLEVSFVQCIPLKDAVVWRLAVTSPDCEAPIELRAFDGRGTELAIDPIVFEDQLIEKMASANLGKTEIVSKADATPLILQPTNAGKISSGLSDDSCSSQILPLRLGAKPKRRISTFETASTSSVRRITYSIRLPRAIAAFGITAQQGEAVFDFYLDEATVSRQIATMTKLRRNAWDQESFDRWLLSRPSMPADPNEQPSFPLEVNGTHVAIAGAGVLVDPDWLETVAAVLQDKPETVALYTDHDLISRDGRHTYPMFKPDFSPDFLHATNYLGDLLVVRKDVYDPALDVWELASKAAKVALETGAPFIHVPHILWHKLDGESTNTRSDDLPCALLGKNRSFQPPQGAKRPRNENEDSSQEPDEQNNSVEKPSDSCPSIDIIIPNKDHADVLENCVRSILELATYPNYDITIVENGSVQPETFEIYEQLCALDPRVHVLRFEDAHQSDIGNSNSSDHRNSSASKVSPEFNYSRLINFGVAHTANPYLLLLNNDTQVIEPDFLQLMMEPLAQPCGGVVGAKLLFRDGLVQHVGMIIGPDGTVVHATQDVEATNPGYMGRNVLTTNVSAVTGACQMVSRETFDLVGGYSEEFAVGFNDADFCCKVRETGRFVTVVPGALLYHFEFTSRGREATDPSKIARWEGERDLFRSRWSTYFEDGDPFSNQNFNPNSKTYGL